MMTKIFLGTNNKHKISEFIDILSPLDIELDSLLTTRIFNFNPPEKANNFDDNAQTKALIWARRVSLPTLAEDSGLCIYALGNFPGVKSKRFISGSDQDRNHEILSLLKRFPDEADRSAFYLCSLAFYDPMTKTRYLTQGHCYGKISSKPKGDQGFGYDPIFIPNGYSQTLGQLPSSVKNQISHRKKAIEKMLPLLQQWLKTIS